MTGDTKSFSVCQMLLLMVGIEPSSYETEWGKKSVIGLEVIR